MLSYYALCMYVFLILSLLILVSLREETKHLIIVFSRPGMWLVLSSNIFMYWFAGGKNKTKQNNVTDTEDFFQPQVFFPREDFEFWAWYFPRIWLIPSIERCVLFKTKNLFFFLQEVNIVKFFNLKYIIGQPFFHSHKYT